MRLLFWHRQAPDPARRAMDVGAGAILAAFLLPAVPAVLGLELGPLEDAGVNAVMVDLMAAGAYSLAVMPLVLFAVYTVHPWRPVLSAQAHVAALTSAGVTVLFAVTLIAAATGVQKVLLGALLGLASLVALRALGALNRAPPKGDPSVGRPIAVLLGASLLVGATGMAQLNETPRSYHVAAMRSALRSIERAQEAHYDSTGRFSDLAGLRFDRNDARHVQIAVGPTAWSARAESDDPWIACHATGRPPGSGQQYAQTACVRREPVGETLAFIAIGWGVPLVLALTAWSWATRQAVTPGA